MNAMIKPQVAAMPGHATIESIEVNLLVAPGVVPVAANSDWFEDLQPDLFDIQAYDNEPWVEETSGIEETWSRVQDIWLRLARQPGIACTTLIDAAQGNQLVMFLPNGVATDGEGARLLELAACSRTYRWKEQGRQGSLVSHVAWCGDSLVIDLTPFERMQFWPGAQGLVWQMQALLCRLRALRSHA
jgi:hypothetical protein